MLTHGELFAGISGFGLGFDRAGMETVWHVEIDEQCQQVLRHHYPDALILGDVKECGKHNLPYVDVISFGTPCQDLSVAGKRKGLEGERSGLFYEAIRIVSELEPALAVWENVPGAFSSNSGRDFAAALSAFRECGARDIAWRVLDAQYLGVPQRRRRIFLIADFRGERSAEVLFESESCPWDPEESAKAGEETTRDTGEGFATSGRGWWREGVGPLAKTEHKGERHVIVQDDEPECLTPWDHESKRIHPEEGTAPTLAGSDKQSGQRMPYVAQRTFSPHSHYSYEETEQSSPVHDLHRRYSGSDILNVVGTYQQNSMEGRGTLGWDEEAKVLRPIKPQSDHQMVVSQYGNVAGTLTKRQDGSPCADRRPTVVAFAQNTRDEVRLQGGDGQTSGSLSAQPGTKQQTYVLEIHGGSKRKDRPEGGFYVREMPTTKPLDTSGLNPSCAQGGVIVADSKQEDKDPIIVETAHRGANQAGWRKGATYPVSSTQAIAFRTNQTGAQGPIHSEEVTDSLAQDHPPAIALQLTGDRDDPSVSTYDDVHPTISANPMSDRKPAVTCQYGIRRLMPIECERLQGFPDGRTLVGKMSDTARYRMLGNAVAVPVVYWLGKRIVENLED